MTDQRAQAFKRNLMLEQLLAEMAADMAPAEQQLMQGYQQMAGMPHPLILVMGPLRSGTTLFMQWLAGSGLVAYPTNLLSRFYHAPILGAKIQLLLTDARYNFRNELGEFAAGIDFNSENGKTTGALAPNEFWYFWRRFLSDPQQDVWTDEDLRQGLNIHALKAELNGMMAVFDKPFAAKGMIFNYNIGLLDQLFENIIFIHLERDFDANVASILKARTRQSGSAEDWYSFKIPEYDSLRSQSPRAQAEGQVRSIQHAISEGLRNVSATRKLYVQYEAFCAQPALVHDQLCALLGLQLPYQGPPSFTSTNAQHGHAG